MTNKKELIELLSSYFDKVKLYSFNRQRVMDYCSDKYNLDISNYIFKANALSSAKESELFQLADGFSQLTGYDVEKGNYFTAEEIATYSNVSANKAKLIMEYKRGDTLEFPALEIVPDEHWLVCLTVRQIADLAKGNFFNYNLNTQREAKEKIVDGERTYTATIYKKKIEQIKKLILEGRYISDELSINITPSSEEPILVMYDSGTLMVENVSFDVIDGWHRLSAIICAANETEDSLVLDMKFAFDVFRISEDLAKRFIIQKDKQTTLRKSYVKSITKGSEETTAIASAFREFDGPSLPEVKEIINYEAFSNAIVRFCPYKKGQDKVLYRQKILKMLEDFYSAGILFFDKDDKTKPSFISNTDVLASIAMYFSGFSIREIKERLEDIHERKIIFPLGVPKERLIREGVLKRDEQN